MFRRYSLAPLVAAFLAGLSPVLLAGLVAAQTSGSTPGADFTPANSKGQIEVVLKNHVFTPNQVVVPANKEFRILLKNEDATSEEFESHSLKVEKVVGGGQQSVIRIRPLAPGEYPFVGEFNENTAKGVVIAK